MHALLIYLHGVAFMSLQYILCAQYDDAGVQIARNFLLISRVDINGILLGTNVLQGNECTFECGTESINQRGIRIIEVKNWLGHIKTERVNLQRKDGITLSSQFLNRETKANLLLWALENSGFRNSSVVGIVVFADPYAQLQNSDAMMRIALREDKIFHLDETLNSAITDQNHIFKPNNSELSLQLIQQIIQTLLSSSIDHKRECIRDFYQASLSQKSFQEPRTYVNYSFKENEFGVKLVKDLRHALGEDSAVRCSVPGRSQEGDDWRSKIRKKLILRDVFIVILTTNTITSSWINSGFNLTWRQKSSKYWKYNITVLQRLYDIGSHLHIIQYSILFPSKTFMEPFNGLLAVLGEVTNCQRQNSAIK
jgi:hypothetical protein